MVGCALGLSRLSFTPGFGIVNEVYYTRVDIPQIRDLGFIVADGEGFWAEVKRVADYQLRLLTPGVPDRRARALRTRGRARSAALSRSDVPDGEPRRHATGAGMGRRPGPEPAARARSADRVGDAAGVGPCRVHQAVDLMASRAPDRPAAGGLAALSGAPADGASRLLVAARADRRASDGRASRGGAATIGSGALGPGRMAGDCRHADPRRRSRMS